MREIKLDSLFGDCENTQFFDPVVGNGKKWSCCCGYELIKESEDTYRCTGGNHRYHISKGDVSLDVYGNTLLRKPNET